MATHKHRGHRSDDTVLRSLHCLGKSQQAATRQLSLMTSRSWQRRGARGLCWTAAAQRATLQTSCWSAFLSSPPTRPSCTDLQVGATSRGPACVPASSHDMLFRFPKQLSLVSTAPLALPGPCTDVMHAATKLDEDGCCVPAGLPTSTAREAEQAARKLLSRGVSEVLVKMGSKGSFLVTGNRTSAPKSCCVIIYLSGCSLRSYASPGDLQVMGDLSSLPFPPARWWIRRALGTVTRLHLLQRCKRASRQPPHCALLQRLQGFVCRRPARFLRCHGEKKCSSFCSAYDICRNGFNVLFDAASKIVSDSQMHSSLLTSIRKCPTPIACAHAQCPCCRTLLSVNQISVLSNSLFPNNSRTATVSIGCSLPDSNYVHSVSYDSTSRQSHAGFCFPAPPAAFFVRLLSPPAVLPPLGAGSLHSMLNSTCSTTRFMSSTQSRRSFLQEGGRGHVMDSGRMKLTMKAHSRWHKGYGRGIGMQKDGVVPRREQQAAQDSLSGQGGWTCVATLHMRDQHRRLPELVVPSCWRAAEMQCPELRRSFEAGELSQKKAHTGEWSACASLQGPSSRWRWPIGRLPSR